MDHDLHISDPSPHTHTPTHPHTHNNNNNNNNNNNEKQTQQQRKMPKTSGFIHAVCTNRSDQCVRGYVWYALVLVEWAVVVSSLSDGMGWPSLYQMTRSLRLSCSGHIKGCMAHEDMFRIAGGLSSIRLSSSSPTAPKPTA